MNAQDPAQRFSSRVNNYARYRPSYPAEVLNLLRKECGLTADSLVADIAFGTGIFTRMILENGNRVLGIEPNADMRRAGEKYLADFPRFTSVDGSAEATTLPDHCVDIITAAQAAHWFDREKARREFARILKPKGWCVLLWNERRIDSTPFLRAYEALLQTYSTDYPEVRHEHTTAVIHEFFAPAILQERAFEMRQTLDYVALEGRLCSSSYTPEPEDARYQPMLRELRAIFDAHQLQGKVIVEYDTRVFYGQLD